METNHDIVEPVYELTQYDGKAITTRKIGEAERLSLRPESSDHFISKSLGVFGFKDDAGNWVEHQGLWPRMGPVCLAILEAVQWHHGVYLTPEATAEATNIGSLRENGNLSARVCAIRKAHKDLHARFIETRRSGGFAIRWVPGRTWTWLEHILTPRPAGPE